MTAIGASATNPELLRRVADWRDDPAWREFYDRYAPFVAARCSVYGLDPDSVDELCQRVWVELARRMPTFQYDPGGSFRGWLRRLCHHRAVDLLRERRGRHLEAIGGAEPIDDRWRRDIGDGETDDDERIAPARLRLLREAMAIQEEVRRGVKPARWEAFWRVVIEGQPIGEAAAALGLKYATVYAGVNHVADRLRAEGMRRGAHPGEARTS